MLYTFEPKLEHVHSIKFTPTIEQVANETMLFNSGLNFARDNAGPITQKVLRELHQYDLIPGGEAPSDYNLIIDTRAMMLMKGMYPAIPGWHGDNFPRNTKNGQPLLEEDPHVTHIIVTFATKWFLSNTSFIVNPVTIDVDPDNVWKSVSEQVETVSGFKHYRNQTECEVFQFNQAALHRVKPATENGWRYFFRMALLKKKPLNKIRRQVQVYTTEHGGW